MNEFDTVSAAIDSIIEIITKSEAAKSNNHKIEAIKRLNQANRCFEARKEDLQGEINDTKNAQKDVDKAKERVANDAKSAQIKAQREAFNAELKLVNDKLLAVLSIEPLDEKAFADLLKEADLIKAKRPVG